MTELIEVLHARDSGRVKCERCWHWEKDTGMCIQHPTICFRCMDVLKEDYPTIFINNCIGNGLAIVCEKCKYKKENI